MRKKKNMSKETLPIPERINRATVMTVDVANWIGELKGSPPWSDELRGAVLNFTKSYHPERDATAEAVLDAIEATLRRKRLWNKTIKTRNSQWFLPGILRSYRVRTHVVNQYATAHPCMTAAMINEFYSEVQRLRMSGKTEVEAFLEACLKLHAEMKQTPLKFMPVIGAYDSVTVSDNISNEQITLTEHEDGMVAFVEGLFHLANAEGVLSTTALQASLDALEEI